MSDAGPVRSVAADEAEIAGVVESFFGAFSSGADCDTRLESLRELFLPEAVIVRTCGMEPVVYDVDGFIAPRKALLASGALQEFREWEEWGRTQVFGDVAQRFSGYMKSWVADGTPFSARGMKTLQLVRSPQGWRISAAAWDDERDGLVVPRPPVPGPER